MTDKQKKLGKNKTDYLVLAFIIGIALGLYHCESKADWAIEESHDSTAGSTTFNAGLDRVCVRYIYETGASLAVCPLVAIGGDLQSDSFEIGIADELWPRWEGQITLNRTAGFMDGGATVRRLIGDGPFQMGIGLSYWISQSPGSNSSVTYNLSLRYTF